MGGIHCGRKRNEEGGIIIFYRKEHLKQNWQKDTV